MDRKVEIFKKSLNKDGHHRIGPDAIKIKNCSNDSQHKNVYRVKGEIYDVGLDFVDLLQDNNSIITVMTNRINRIKWEDPGCNDLDIRLNRGVYNQCVEFSHHAAHSRFFNWNRENKRLEDNDYTHLHEVPCTCGKNRCNCKDKQHIKRNEFKRCPHCNEKYKNSYDKCPSCDHHESHNQYCGPRFTCFRDSVIPFCDDRIELRLAGLTDHVNFQLFQHKGCKVEIDIS